MQLGLVLTQWLHALPPQQDNNVYARLRAVLELQHEWLQLGVVPHTTGLNPVVVPHTTIATRGGCRTPGWHHDHDTRRGCDTWITLLSPRV